MAKSKTSDLTDKQEIFCLEYLKDLNGKQAAIRAGYSEKTAQEHSSRMLTNVKVQARIQGLKEKRAERCEITADMILNELAAIGFSKITDYLKVEDIEDEETEDEEGNSTKKTLRVVTIFKTDEVDAKKSLAISEIRQTKEGISLKVHDKIKALELIGKHIGFFEKDNEQSKVNFPAPQIILNGANRAK